jgi:hypothetical protein
MKVNHNLTDINIVLDRSGSMSSVKDDTEGGFNEFIKEQQKVSGQCFVSLYQFDDIYETVYEARDIHNVSRLNLVPRNSTALLDAIGRTVDQVGARLSRMYANDRPSKVICVIITDGHENSSKEYSRCSGGYERIAEKISHQRNVYNWQFVFIGANQDAIASACSMGIKSALNYTANKLGTENLYKSLSKNIRSSRLASTDTFNTTVQNGIFFDQDDVQAQEDAKV